MPIDFEAATAFLRPGTMFFRKNGRTQEVVKDFLLDELVREILKGAGKPNSIWLHTIPSKL